MSPKKKKFNTGNVIAIASAHLLHDTFSAFFAPLIPLLTEKFGISYAAAGSLSVVQKIPSLLNPLIGLIADKIAIRSAIVLAPIITILTMGLLGWAPSVAILAVLLFTCGISAASLHVTAPVLMRQVSGDQIGKGMSAFMFGGEIARTLGPLLITAAISLWGLEGTWRLIPLGLVASLVLFISLRKIDKAQLHTVHNPNKASIKETLRHIAPAFALMTPIMLSRSFSKTALTTFLPAYMVSQGSSAAVAATALALLELFGAIGALLSGSLSDKAGRKNVLLVIMLISPVLMYFFTKTTGIAQWAILGGMGLIFFASTPVFMAMVHDLNTDRPAFTNGLYMSVSFAVSSIVALAVGAMADHYGFVRTYQITAMLSAAAIPFTLRLKNPEKSFTDRRN